MTYSLTRFAIYETVRDQVAKGSEGPLPFYKKVLLGAISGEQLGGPTAKRGWGRPGGCAWVGPRGQPASGPTSALGSVTPGCIGGFVGTPADMVNVRSVGLPTVRVHAVPIGVRAQPGGRPWTSAFWAQGTDATEPVGAGGGSLGGQGPAAPERTWPFQDAE